MIHIKTLRNITVGGAFVCVASGLYFTRRIQEGFRKTEYYQKSIEIFMRNSSVISVLGEPVKEGAVDLADSENFVNGLVAKLCIPVKGTKTKGRLCLWASRKDITNSWFIERLELVVKDEPNAKLIVYNANRDAPASVESK